RWTRRRIEACPQAAPARGTGERRWDEWDLREGRRDQEAARPEPRPSPAAEAFSGKARVNSRLGLWPVSRPGLFTSASAGSGRAAASAANYAIVLSSS